MAAGGALCACVSAEHPVGLMLLPMCTFHPVWRFFFRISGPQRAASSVTSQLLSPSEPMWLCAIGPGGWSQAPGPAAGLGLGPVLPAPDGPRFLKMGEVKATLLFLRCATKHFFLGVSILIEEKHAVLVLSFAFRSQAPMSYLGMGSPQESEPCLWLAQESGRIT